MRKLILILVTMISVIIASTGPYSVQARTFVTAPEAITSITVQSGDEWYNIIIDEVPDGATNFSYRWSLAGYPDYNTGTEAHYGTETSYNITGLSSNNGYYFSVFSVAVVGEVNGYSKIAAQSRNIKTPAGWNTMPFIYSNLTGDDSQNHYIANAASNLETILESCSSINFTVVTTEPEGPYIGLALDSSGFNGYSDEAHRIVSDNTNGIRITGKTPRAVMLGVSSLYLELGIRFFIPGNDLWTILPTLSSLPETNNVYDPDFIWRFPKLVYIESDAGDRTEYFKYNRLLGAADYRMQDNMYEHVYPPETYYATDPSAFTGNVSAGWPDGWSLNGYSTNVSQAMTDYIVSNDWFSTYTTLGTNTQEQLIRGAFPCAFNDGGWSIWDPPWSGAQDITDSVMYLGNVVAGNVTVEYPGSYVVVPNYSGASSIPSYNGIYQSNLIVIVAPFSNIRDVDAGDVMDALVARNDVGVGYYDVPMLGSISVDPTSTIQELADYYDENGKFVWFESELYNFEWGLSASRMYMMSRTFWNTSDNTTEMLEDFVNYAFDESRVYMQSFYENIYSKDIGIIEDKFEWLQSAYNTTTDEDELHRIRQQICWCWWHWKRYAIGLSGLSQSDEERLYTLATKLRYTDMINYANREPGIRASLQSKYPETYPDDASVYTLADGTYTEPTEEEMLVYLAEGLEANP